MNSFIINNVNIVTPFSILEQGFVYVKRGMIEAIGQASPGKVHRSCNIIDGNGYFLMPGIIDVLNDSIHNANLQEMKSDEQIDSDFFVLENQLLINGVTAAYHYIDESMSELENKLLKLRRFGVMRHNLSKSKKFNEDYTLLNASGVFQEVFSSVNIEVKDLIYNCNFYVICSDNENISLLQSIFILHNKLNLSLIDTVAMATLNPAIALGIDNKYGSIEFGKNADLILVNCNNEVPVVEQVYVNGCNVFKNKFNLNNNAV